MTYEEVGGIFKEENGRDLDTTYECIVNALQWAMPQSLGATMKCVQEGGYAYEMDRTLAEELGLRDFRTWLREDIKY